MARRLSFSTRPSPSRAHAHSHKSRSWFHPLLLNSYRLTPSVRLPAAKYVLIAHAVPLLPLSAMRPYLFAGLLFFVARVSQSNSIAETEPPDPCYYDELYSIEDVPKCLQHVKEKAADSQLFWFGDNWSQRCGEATAHSWIRCYNPEKLVRYTSLGARLLRVPTFDLAYLRNLLIFPEVTFLSEPGSYTACDHRYETNISRTTTIRPEMDPALPFDLRTAPTIGWPSLNDNDHYIVAIVDVGFGRLDYLAFDFPADTKVARDYRHPENFREQPNPHAVVVFRQSKGRLGSLRLTDAEDEDGLFDLQKFMLDNMLQQDLIGLNWMSVSTDAYAIEKQRIKGLVDNCHSLIRKKLIENRELRFQFLPHFSLPELDAWLSVTYECHPEEFSVCCSTYKIREEIAQLDPVGDRVFSPATLRAAPLIASTRLMPPEIYSYRRSGRDYVALIDGDRFTLLLVQINPSDPKLGDELRPLLHWLVVDIPAAALGAGTLEGGAQLVPYIAPLPEETHPPRRLVFALFMQTDRQLISRRYDSNHFTTTFNCPVEYAGRCNFDVRQLMARHSLRLRAVNWMLTTYDPYVTYEMVRRHGRDEMKTCALLNKDMPVCRPHASLSSPNSSSSVLLLTHWCYQFLFMFSVVRWFF